MGSTTNWANLTIIWIIAAVAAIDEETAKRALELIRVDYEVLPAIFDPEEALLPWPRLAPDGVLFLGHSESIHGLVEGLTHVGNTIYRRAGAPSAVAAR